MSDLQTPRPMDERRKTYLRLIAEICIAIVSVVAVALLGGPVVGILLPFILAFIMAWMFNPVIAWLQRHLRLTRKLFSYILVLVFYALLFGLCLFFAGQLVSQAIDLARSVPTFIADLQGLYNELVTWLQEVLAKLPAEYAGVGDEIFSLLNSAWEWLKTLLSGALSYVMGISRNVALEVPSFVIFLTVLVLASCIITADFPNLRENIYSYLGVRGKNSVRLMGHSFRAAVFGFFRSQLIFALLDMGIILVAFFIIGVPYPLPIALLLAFLDFIPFFGAGTVLVPWGLICMAIGLFDMGLKLLLLYGILYIIRRIFEPRILGGATGFSSLQMLFSMYAGMRIAGVTGLVVAPIVWIYNGIYPKTNDFRVFPRRITIMKNARRLLRKLDYLPRWAWYMLSLFIGGPIGPFVVYLVFHVLTKAAADEETEQDSVDWGASYDRSGRTYADADCTVTDDAEIEDAWQKTESSASRARREAQPAENTQTDSADDEVSEVIREGRAAMRRIRHANDLIPDPELSAQIDSIENSCGQILSILEQRPQLLSQLRTFLRYYLPTTLRLLEARAKLEKSANTPKAREVRARISQAVGEIDTAFRKQVEALDEYRFIDLESEMDVMRDMLKSDGLIDEDEQKDDDPFADVLKNRNDRNTPMGAH